MNKLILAIVSALCLAAAADQPQPAGPCPNAIKINTNYQYRNGLHFICLQASLAGRPRLEVFHYNSGQRLFSTELEDFDTNSLASFLDDEGTLRILLATPSKVNGTAMFSLDQEGRDTRERHTINSQYVSSMAIWRLQLNSVWHLAIANQPHYEPGRQPDSSPKTMLTIHSWRSSYFDSYQMIKLPQEGGRVSKLEPMNIFGQEFLIVALEPQRLPTLARGNKLTHNQPINSLIYKLDFSDGNLNWQLFQSLRSSSALDARAFLLTHQNSLQRDYYIALLGQINRKELPGHITLPQPATRNHGEEYGLLIYKFMGDQFMLTQLLPAPGATKLDALTYGQGDSYVLIALLSDYSNQLSLFLFDGLTLRPVPSPLPVAGRPPPGGRGRRTMEPTELHLFRVPATTSNKSDSEPENLTQKRTMPSDEEPAAILNLPALAFSQPILAANDSKQQAGSVFKIPIEEVISENERQLESQSPEAEEAARKSETAGRKRAFVGASSGQELLNWCRANVNALLSDSFNELAKQISALPRIDQARPIELNGDLIIENDLLVSNLLYANEVRELAPNQTRSVPLPQSDFSQTFGRIQEVHNEIDQVARRVEQILVDDGSQQDVFAPLIFDTVFVDCANPISMVNGVLEEQQGNQCPYVNEIRTQLLNSRNISNIQQQALLTGRNMVITSDVRFEHLVLKGSVDILSTLNGLSVDNIVFKVGPSKGVIVGEKTFLSGLYSKANLLVDRWNNFPIDRQHYLLSTGEQRIETALRLNQVMIDTPPQASTGGLSSRIERLNGIHLDMHLSAIATSDELDSTFEVPVYFDELHLNGPIDFKALSLLSSVNIDQLWASTMFKHSNQNISAPITFAGSVRVSYGGDILVRGSVNNIAFNPNTIMLRTNNYKLSNPLIIEGNLRVNKLLVYKALNGIQVVDSSESWQVNPRLGELSILYNGGSQMITADKIFNNIHLAGDSIIRGNINGHLNLTELHQLANNQNAPHRFSTIRLTGKDIRISNRVQIHVDNSINGIPINDLCMLAVKVALAPQNISTTYNRLRFEGPLKFKSLQCKTVNGFPNLADSFLTRNGNQKIAGTLSLTGGVVFNSTINVQSSLNNLNIEPLARGIAQTLNDTRTGRRDFYGDLFLEDLITDRINDLQLRDVFLARSDLPQIVRARMAFNHLDIENVLIVHKNLQTNSFNGINITDLIFNSMQYDTPQDIYNHVEVDTLHLLAGSNLQTNSLNGFNLQRLFSDAVFVDTYQQIPASKTFRAPVQFSNRLLFHLGLDGLSKEELRSSMLLHSDELIEGDLEFNNDVYVRKELEILSNIINDMDVNLFFDSVLYETKLKNDQNNGGMRIFGNGSVRFNDVRLNNLIVAGTVQGLDVSREALLRSENINGSLNDRIREQQFAYENQRFLDLYGGQPRQQNFRVFSHFRGLNHTGTCKVHSCSKTSMQPPVIQPLPPVVQPLPVPQNLLRVPYPAAQQQPYYPLRFAHRPPPAPIPIRPPQQQPALLPALPLLKWTPPADGRFVWQPAPPNQTNIPTQQASSLQVKPPPTDAKLLEYQNMLQAEAIRQLSHNINRYLPVSFYYEIAQKHPGFGPVLNAAQNPIDRSESLLLLKAVGSNGEPCLKKGQTIAVMAQQRQARAPTFSVSTRITETSNPVAVESLELHHNTHFLVVLEEGLELTSQLLIYVWDKQMGRFVNSEVISLDGHPTAMKLFSRDNKRIGCIGLAMPKQRTANLSGPPLFYCQRSPMGNFSAERLVLPIQNVFDLDVESSAPNGTGGQLVLASLSQMPIEQMGTLNLHTYDFNSKTLSSVGLRRLSRPTRVRFFRSGPRKLQPLRLVVTEAITSNDDDEAMTRLYSLTPRPGVAFPSNFINSNTHQLEETQIIRDSQFRDIQSVQLDEFNSLLFLRSDNFIHIYGPILQAQEALCGPQYSLVQRLPTKGANRFLVFNEMPASYLLAVANHQNSTGMVQADQKRARAPLKHFLILSSDACEQRNYWTLVLRAKFN